MSDEEDEEFDDVPEMTCSRKRNASPEEAEEHEDAARVKKRRLQAGASTLEEMQKHCVSFIMVKWRDGSVHKMDIPFEFDIAGPDGGKMCMWAADAEGFWGCSCCKVADHKVVYGPSMKFAKGIKDKQRVVSKVQHNTTKRHVNALASLVKLPEGHEAIRWPDDGSCRKFPDYIRLAPDIASCELPRLIPCML